MKVQDKQSYYKSLLEKAETILVDDEKKLAQLIIKQAKVDYYSSRDYSKRIYELLEQMNPGETISLLPLVNIVKKWLGEENGDLFHYMVKHIADYPYSVGYYRRPFRTINLKVNFPAIIHRLVGMIELNRHSFNILKYLTEREHSLTGIGISSIIAYELDRGNREVFEALKEIIFGENNTALLNKWMIEGILHSHDTEAYKMLGELLLAARLQEGLRQSIVESMDEGTIEANLYLLKIIMEHDLIRYSSVVRALDVWTGLNLEAANKRVVKQCIEYVYHALTDPAIREEWLESPNVNQLYISLWATAVYEEEDSEAKIVELMKKGAAYQKIVALSFLTESQNTGLKNKIAGQYLDEKDPELLYYILSNLEYHVSFTGNYFSGNHAKFVFEKVGNLEDKDERTRQFFLLKEMLENLPKKEVSFPSKVFEGREISISSDMIAQKLLYLAVYDMDQEWINQILFYKDKLSSDFRNDLITYYLKDFTNPTQREFLFDSLSDKSMSNREIAMKKIAKLDLTEEEVEKVEAILKLKTGSLRQQAIQLILSLRNECLECSIDRLLASKQELQRLGALEILTELKEIPESHDSYAAFIQKIKSMTDPTEKEKVLLNKLVSSEVEDGLKNGFGLYDPNQKAHVPLKDYPATQLSDVFTLTTEDIMSYLNGLSELIDEHRHFEYEVEHYDGYKETVLLGTQLSSCLRQIEDGKSVDRLPLSEVWQNYQLEKGLATEEIVQIHFLLSSDELYRYFYNQLNRWERGDFPVQTNTRQSLLSSIYPFEQMREVKTTLNKMEFQQQITQLVEAFFDDLDKREAFEFVCNMLSSMIKVKPEKEFKTEKKLFQLLVQPWMDWACQFVYDDESFKVYFAYIYYSYTLFNYRSFEPSLEDFAKAYELNILDEAEIYRELFNRKSGRHHLWHLTNDRDEFFKKHPLMQPLKRRAVGKILDIELNRGELPTEVTALALEIQRFEGMNYFIQLLLGMDKETFVRGYIYSYGGKATKKEAFSHLLKTCHPLSGEDEVLLGQLLKGKKVSEKRLLEAAMYAPQWIEIVSNYLKWDGLRSAAWYFHAHVNETFSAEKETIVAHYSPIKPEDFNDGAFDIAWFKEAYEQMGEKRFKVLYDCAKYISGGANHRRSQLFADAILGKLKLEDVKKSAMEKRNKDQLLCYSLIPISLTNEKDVLQRYEFLQAFLKESKQFGAQRRASESKAVAIALENLARNAGYKDVIRLQWEMEAKKLEEIQPYLAPMEVDDLLLQLVIDGNGKADIQVSKNGKSLKSVPAKFNKHEYVLELKTIKSDLNNQYKRAKEELERAMEKQNSFTLSELIKMMNNPVISPLLEALVFKVNEHLGYFMDGRLVGNEEYRIEEQDEIVIAHPVHFFESGHWSDFQRDLFNRQVKQPFKQVFRELYIPNQDELAAGTASLRYAGHQVQPRKTAALLKGRNWTVSYEEGLQKVYYKENIIAKIYALADWFSPSDVESPTLETVEFFDRHTYKSIELKEVPKILFSETMRDVELVVSVAHVGGVDPEASLTTIEMRKSIASESIRLLKLDNVRLEGNFALIQGRLGDYSVHLGSANAYKQASGALFIVPVHSQHRGRIFLPFMDEDPRTAEIVSKILMLAQDQKIKDPYILEQMK